MKLSGFDWDEGNIEKCQKHGVTLSDIEFVLANTPHVAPDPKHSTLEDRFIAIGKNKNNRAVFVAFAFRHKYGKRFIRPVSARYMHRKEIREYEKESS